MTVRDCESVTNDIAAGRCYVVLGDGETWDTVWDCHVLVAAADQYEGWEWGDPPEGYLWVPVDVLVKHYLATATEQVTGMIKQEGQR